MSTENTETATETREALGEAGQKALRAEREARRAAEARAQAAEARVAELETASVRAAVAAEKGLSDAQAARLTGSTREELEADADELLAAFKPAEEEPAPTVRRSPVEQLRPGAVPGAQPDRSMADVAVEVLGS